jgi:lipopolysaccharide export LptBFGC system permease protein LptF
MLTLHSYILRELLKTFGLTLAALTVLFTLSGGAFNVIRFEGVSAVDFAAFLPVLVPIVVTLTMPMAALFAVTMTYGRLAADNELLACRAAGINIHRLFLSVVLLSVFVASFTLLFGSFVIPEYVKRLEEFGQRNIRDFVAQQLQQKGFVHRGGRNQDRYTLTAEHVQDVTPQALQDRGFETAPGLHYLLISNPTLLHVDRDGALVRFVVAKHVLCAFDTRVRPLEITFHVRDGRDFEVGKRATVISQNQIGPLIIDPPQPARLSTARLTDLLYWQRNLWRAPKLEADVRRFLDDFMRQRFYQQGAETLQAKRKLDLTDASGVRYVVSGREAHVSRHGLAVQGGHVDVLGPQGEKKAYDAGRVELQAVVTASRQRPAGPLGTGSLGQRPVAVDADRDLLVEIRLLPAPGREVTESATNGTSTPPRVREALSLHVTTDPADVLSGLEAYTPAAVLKPEASWPVEEDLGDRRFGLMKAAAQMYRKITATIHFRTAYTASALVTLLMGAALGVVFRGSRALAAFALALVPFLSVIVLLVLGRQLTEGAATALVGPFVTWGGLVLVLLADGIILRAGVRR